MLIDKFWQEGISLCIDASGFQHKYNPHDETRSIRTMAWRLKNEGFHPQCTAKGYHVGPGGRVAHFIVVIAHQEVLFYVNSINVKLMTSSQNLKIYKVKHEIKSRHLWEI